MAVSSNRCPIPSPATSRSNPNSRNSEINNTVRRSFSGNPFTKPSIVANPRGFNPVTPANSPSGFPRRHSIGKEGGVPPRHYEKENEKDQNAKPVGTRPPAVSNGTKNFMSPTISAASKIVVCPKKNVLLERNELVRPSLPSFSAGKSPLSPVNLQEVVEDSDSKSAYSDSTTVDPGKREEHPVAPSSKASKGDEVLDFHQVPLKSKNDSESLSETINMGSDGVGIDVCSKTKPSSSPPSTSILAPLGAVLLERKELVRTSLPSFSDGKSPLIPVNLQEAVEDSDSKSAYSDSTTVAPGKREECPVAPSSKASKGDEVLDFHPVPLKSKNDSESLSETITMGSDCVGSETITMGSDSVGVDVSSKTKPSPSRSSTSFRGPPLRPNPARGYDPSRPYDPITNYLVRRPKYLYYKPNPRVEKLAEIREALALRGHKNVEFSVVYKILSDMEDAEAYLSGDSSSVELEEGQNEEVEESEAGLAETAQEEPNVPEPNNGRTLEAKEVSKSYSLPFRLKPILFLLLVLVGCSWMPITDSPCICSVMDSSVGKESSFTKLYDPAELAEFARTNFDGLTRSTRLWSANRVSYISKMILIVKEANELSFLRFGNLTDSQVDLVGGGYLVKENQQSLQWPMKELEVEIVQMKEQGNLVTEAYEKVEEASQVNLEFEEARLTGQAEVIEPDNSELEQIQEEYHIASHTDLEQASQDKTELEEANLSLQAEVVKPHNSEVQQTEEESSVAFHNDREAQSIIAEKEQEVQVSQVSEIKPEKVPAFEKLQGENKLISHAEVVVQQTEEESSVAFHIDHEAQSTIDEKEEEVQVSQVSEIKPENVLEAEKLQGENKSISHAEVEMEETEEESSVAFHIDHEAQSIIAEKEQEVQVSRVSEIKPEKVPEAEKLQGQNKLSSCAEDEVQQIEEESSVASHVDPEAQIIIAEKKQEVQVSQVSEMKTEVHQAEKLHGENKLISHAEVGSSGAVFKPSHVDPEAQSIITEKEQEVQVSQVSEMKTEVPRAEKLHGENKLISHTEVESSGAVFEPESSESEPSTTYSQGFKELYLSLEEKSSAVDVLGISLLILILTVTEAFVFLKKQKPPTQSPAAIPMDQLLAKKLAPIPTARVGNTRQRLPSRNWPTEVDMVGESCPSEMSSFQRSTSYSKRGSKGVASFTSECSTGSSSYSKRGSKGAASFTSECSMGASSYSKKGSKGASFTSEYSMDSSSYSKKGSKGANFTSEYSMGSSSYCKKGSKGASEAQSQERGGLRKSNKRESLASSMVSPSYGSFTSYEKIHIRHGCRDEEVVTPLRRSSRIRNQVTSR